MHLNGYVPSLQTGGGFVGFVKTQLDARVPSTMMVAPMTQRSLRPSTASSQPAIDLVAFEKGQSKDECPWAASARIHDTSGKVA